jgi:hypothetical protein
MIHRTYSQSGHFRNEAGFTLVVIAALFIAFAVIAAVAVERNTTVQLITRRDAANVQLTKLSNAIIEYAVFNQTGGKLIYPCPAKANEATSVATFGKSVDNGTTQDCSTVDYTGVTTLTGPLANTDVIRGMVPIQTLSQYGLGVNDAFDPWNNRIMYVVNRQLTQGGSGSNSNNPTISDNTTQSFSAPDFILISYGRDGVGATRRESVAVSIACAAAATKARLENCDNDTAFTYIPTYTAATAGDTSYFDDILSFYRQ